MANWKFYPRLEIFYDKDNNYCIDLIGESNDYVEHFKGKTFDELQKELVKSIKGYFEILDDISIDRESLA